MIFNKQVRTRSGKRQMQEALAGLRKKQKQDALVGHTSSSSLPDGSGATAVAVQKQTEEIKNDEQQSYSEYSNQLASGKVQADDTLGATASELQELAEGGEEAATKKELANEIGTMASDEEGSGL
jgi:hypothetical protein